jgi:hypothetical protein
MIPVLRLSFEAGAATTPFRFARFSDAAASSKVANGAANTDPLIGVFGSLPAAIGEMADVTVDGQEYLELGGTVTAGAPLTTDAQGRGIVAAPAAATTVRIGAFALEPGVSGDRIKVLVGASLLRTP